MIQKNSLLFLTEDFKSMLLSFLFPLITIKMQKKLFQTEYLKESLAFLEREMLKKMYSTVLEIRKSTSAKQTFISLEKPFLKIKYFLKS